ncbi:unnamed protein product, partial [Symbiodinium sp. KB8]
NYLGPPLPPFIPAAADQGTSGAMFVHSLEVTGGGSPAFSACLTKSSQMEPLPTQTSGLPEQFHKYVLSTPAPDGQQRHYTLVRRAIAYAVDEDVGAAACGSGPIAVFHVPCGCLQVALAVLQDIRLEPCG